MARRVRLDLLVNTTGSGSAQDWPGGEGVFFVEAATFGGGNVTLEFQGPNGNWVPVASDVTGANIALTAVGMAKFAIGAGAIRATATTATAVYASAVGIPANAAG